MRKILFSICLLFVGFVSNAQDGIKDYGVVWSGVHNDIICGDSMFILHDFAFYIDNTCRLYRVFDWEDISSDRMISNVYFYFRILLKNKKYAKTIKTSGVGGQEKSRDSDYFWTSYMKSSETESRFRVVNVSPDDVDEVELTSVEIETKDGERYTLSGFPKYSKIRRKEQK